MSLVRRQLPVVGLRCVSVRNTARLVMDRVSQETEDGRKEESRKRPERRTERLATTADIGPQLARPR
ncbi:hypothetical protein BaRGS_00004961 [Batillaria attramentaria]|uniref:Uncharacterized protein n=1 Tax=Batillaria attramentaria TaxID=370345 RepID=A0ABD0LXJ2_9CAEN